MINYRERSWIQRTCKHSSESQFNSKWLIFPFTSLMSNDDSATLDDHSKGLSLEFFGENTEYRPFHSQLSECLIDMTRNQQKHEIFHTKKSEEKKKKKREKPPDREGKRRNYFYASQNLIFHSLSLEENSAPKRWMNSPCRWMWMGSDSRENRAKRKIQMNSIYGRYVL